jgi:hypothetical protein
LRKLGKIDATRQNGEFSLISVGSGGLADHQIGMSMVIL